MAAAASKARSIEKHQITGAGLLAKNRLMWYSAHQHQLALGLSWHISFGPLRGVTLNIGVAAIMRGWRNRGMAASMKRHRNWRLASRGGYFLRSVAAAVWWATKTIISTAVILRWLLINRGAAA
jgi:hypothetical protein